MTKKMKHEELINLAIIVACMVASAFLFVTTLDREITTLEKTQWKTK